MLFGARTVCALVGSVYPTYASYRAALRSDSAEEHKQWLCYWICYTGFAVVEALGDALVSWLPLYWEAKICALVWLSLFGGAGALYNSVVRAFLDKYEDAIDGHVGRLQAAAAESVSAAAGQGVATLRAHSASVVSTGLSYLAQANATLASAAAAPPGGPPGEPAAAPAPAER